MTGVALFYDCGDVQERTSAIASAAHSVASGQLVVLPTDTVYGVGADAFDAKAVASLLAAKRRGRDMPVPVLVGSWTTIEGLASVVSGRTWDLIEAFWPGGLTLVVEHTYETDDGPGDEHPRHFRAVGERATQRRQAGRNEQRHRETEQERHATHAGCRHRVDVAVARSRNRAPRDSDPPGERGQQKATRRGDARDECVLEARMVNGRHDQPVMSGTTSRSASALTAPVRSTRGISAVTSTIVEATPVMLGPPSR